MNKRIRVALGWEDVSLIGHVVSRNKLRYEGLYTFLGMVGYCMKDNGKIILGLSSTTCLYHMYSTRVGSCTPIPFGYSIEVN